MAQQRDEGHTASEEETGIDLNNVADLLVILVGKYMMVIKLIWILNGILGVGITLIIFTTLKMGDIQTSQEIANRKIIEANNEIVQARRELRETRVEVQATKKQVKEAAEAAPKIEVDPDSGVAKVVVQAEKRLSCKTKGCGEKAPAKNPMLLPLDPQLGVDNSKH